MFRAAVGSALPQQCLPSSVPAPSLGRTVVVGAGKASAAMARALEGCWPASLSGVVVTRYGHAVACDAITILEAGHPVPDAASVEAGRRILDAVSGLSADDLMICLMSGGGSALLSALPPGVSLEDERALSKALLKSGATIEEMNCVRKHVSLIKGGRLAAAAAPARVVT
ncbi:glycerate-2-kinase family protein, partial [Sphingomonas koreensis]|uniref:glycerate-2-kinase family protein n=1 Tax=Sphingomonas koreensis TaxID=93064 RepID=UPI001F49A31A